MNMVLNQSLMISYPYIKVSPNPHQRNFAVDDDQHRESQLAKVQIIRDYRILKRNGSTYTAPPLQKLRGHCRRGYGTRVRGRGDEQLHGNNVFWIQQGICKYELTVVVIGCTRYMQA